MLVETVPKHCTYQPTQSLSHPLICPSIANTSLASLAREKRTVLTIGRRFGPRPQTTPAPQYPAHTHAHVYRASMGGLGTIRSSTLTDQLPHMQQRLDAKTNNVIQDSERSEFNSAGYRNGTPGDGHTLGGGRGLDDHGRDKDREQNQALQVRSW